MTDDDRPGWMTHGLCRTGDAELMNSFFPVRGQSARPAKKICAKCPVIDQCREYALVNNIKFGIWGGMSERERRQERRRRAADGRAQPRLVVAS